MRMHAHTRTHTPSTYIHIYVYILLYTCTQGMSLLCTTQDFYQEGEYIIHQGGIGDTFFIINVGSVSQW